MEQAANSAIVHRIYRLDSRQPEFRHDHFCSVLDGRRFVRRLIGDLAPCLCRFLTVVRAGRNDANGFAVRWPAENNIAALIALDRIAIRKLEAERQIRVGGQRVGFFLYALRVFVRLIERIVAGELAQRRQILPDIRVHHVDDVALGVLDYVDFSSLDARIGGNDIGRLLRHLICVSPPAGRLFIQQGFLGLRQLLRFAGDRACTAEKINATDLV